MRALVVLLLAAAACGRPAPPAHPNILLVTLDTTRADHLGAYGNKDAATPVFDRIAKEGVLFESVWTPTPLTTPAHASLMTGLYPAAHGVRNNGRLRLPAEAATLASVLAAAGYETGAFVGAFPVSRPFGFATGFKTFDDDFGQDEKGRSRPERTADQVAARAMPWLAKMAKEDAPFFAWVHFYDAHDPYTPPSPYAERFRARPYDGEIAFADATLGRIVGALRDAGVLDRTVVAVAGDHGEGLGDHGEPTHGLLLYEPMIHVPLAIRAPWTVAAGKRIAAPASLVDLAPTLAALARVPFPEVDGADLFGRGAPARDVYAETHFAAEEFGWAELSAVRRGPAKWIEAPRPERYELDTDAREAENLAGRDPAADAALRQALRGASSRHRLASSAASLDDEALAKLQSLGYVGSGGTGDAAAPGTQRRDPKDALRDYDDYLHGTEAIHSGGDAVPLFERLVAGDPGNPEFRLRLGEALRARRDLAGAEAAYRGLVERYPDFYLAYRRLADLLRVEGKSGENVALWRTLQARGGGLVGVDARLAEALLADEKSGEALAAAESGLKTSPGDAELLALAARAHERLGHDAEALAGYEAALDSRPSDLSALDGAIALLKRLGRRDDAVALARRCADRSAGDPAVKARLAGI
ncbi:MAG TPA: sulfatase-like hydrolase/transferase [Candidatus Polarisedimenticolaceae bacterium]|nr:sulfatase-like hydrolase/transferase [Candidatus Polarisedimenticolaceae bacterium]